MKRYLLVLFMSFLMLFFLFDIAKAELNDEIFKLIPKEATVVAHLSKIKDYQGLEQMIKLFISKYELNTNKQSLEKIEIIKNLSNCPEIKEACIVLFYLGYRLTQKYVFILKIDDTSEDRRQLELIKSNIGLLIEKRHPLKIEKFNSTDIFYATDRNSRDPAAFVVIKNYLVFGSDLDTIKKIVLTYDNQFQSFLNKQGFRKVKSELNQEDNFVFVDNSDFKFSQVMRKWESEGHVRIFLSANHLFFINLFLDLKDKNEFAGKIIFALRNPKSAVAFDVVQDEARFFNEVLKRKLIMKNLNYINEIKLSGEFVALNFNISNWGSFMEDLILKGVDKEFISNEGMQDMGLTFAKEFNKEVIDNLKLKGKIGEIKEDHASHINEKSIVGEKGESFFGSFLFKICLILVFVILFYYFIMKRNIF